MDIIALIPARGGSKRVPRKNIADLGGKPLIVWTIATCQHCGFDPVVSTDDGEIARVSWDCGAKVILRPHNLSTDDATDYDVIRHACEATGRNSGLVAYLRPTTPFRRSDDVLGALSAFEASGADSLRSVEEMAESAYKGFKVVGAALKPLMVDSVTAAGCPNHLFERTYKGNGVIDIVRAENVIKGYLWGENVLAYITPPTIEIDTPFELELARYWAATRGGERFVSFRQA